MKHWPSIYARIIVSAQQQNKGERREKFNDHAKMVIMPKDAICDNLYKALLEWPSRCRDCICHRCPMWRVGLANAPGHALGPKHPCCM